MGEICNLLYIIFKDTQNNENARLKSDILKCYTLWCSEYINNPDEELKELHVKYIEYIISFFNEYLYKLSRKQRSAIGVNIQEQMQQFFINIITVYLKYNTFVGYKLKAMDIISNYKWWNYIMHTEHKHKVTFIYSK